MRLIHAEHGKCGVIRVYQHARFGRVQVITTWREAGAHVIRIETERDRERLTALTRAAVAEARRETARKRKARRGKAGVS